MWKAYIVNLFLIEKLSIKAWRYPYFASSVAYQSQCNIKARKSRKSNKLCRHISNGAHLGRLVWTALRLGMSSAKHTRPTLATRQMQSASTKKRHTIFRDAESAGRPRLECCRLSTPIDYLSRPEKKCPLGIAGLQYDVQASRALPNQK